MARDGTRQRTARKSPSDGTWSDDRYLLGFYDTFHNRYDPGPTGLATRLLQAQMDWNQGRQGLYLILMDESQPGGSRSITFRNLFCRCGRGLADQPRSIRLYDAATQATNGDEKPIDQLRLESQR